MINDDWVSWSEAARILGCPVSTVEHYARTGRFVRRQHDGVRSTLSRRSVLDFKPTWEEIVRRRTANGEMVRLSAGDAPPPYPDRWISTAGAAALLGTSTYAVRRIARRAPTTPSLMYGRSRFFDRAALLAAHEAREAAGYRPRMPRTVVSRPAPASEPPSDDWISVGTAARILGISERHTRRLASTGELQATVYNTVTWIMLRSAEERQSEQSRWIGYDEAKRLASTSQGRLARAVRDGEVISRGTAAPVPSLLRESVISFAARLREERARERERAAERARPQPSTAPPDGGHVWLSANEAAEILCVSRQTVNHRASADRLPYFQVPDTRRRWYRKDLIEQVAAAERWPLSESGRDVVAQPTVDD